MADITAILRPSGVGLTAETSVDDDADGEAETTYSQSMFRREHRVQRGRISSHLGGSVSRMLAMDTESTYLDSPLFAC